MLQTSTVCRKLATAVEAVICSGKGLNLAYTEEPCQLDSSLLQRWAGFTQILFLWADSVHIPGLLQFVEAATSLEEVRLSCNSMLAASQAEHLILSFRCLSELYLSATSPTSNPLV